MIYKVVGPVANTEPCAQRLTFCCLLQNTLPCRLFSSPSFQAGSCIQCLAQDLLPAWPPTLKSLILLKHSSKVVWVCFTNRESQNPEVQLFTQGEKIKKNNKKESSFGWKQVIIRRWRMLYSCMIGEEKVLDIQIKWQIRKSDIPDF